MSSKTYIDPQTSLEMEYALEDPELGLDDYSPNIIEDTITEARRIAKLSGPAYALQTMGRDLQELAKMGTWRSASAAELLMLLKRQVISRYGTKYVNQAFRICYGKAIAENREQMSLP